jgi:hypothetical protein
MSSSFPRAALVAFLPVGLWFGCTQSFDVFEPRGDVSTSATSTTSSASSTAASTGVGGATGSTASSAASTGVGGQGGAGGVGGTGGVGGAPPPLEDCLDGADNDNDALVDCGDPDCDPGFECVDPVPNGWEGYFRVRTTPAPNANVTMCPDGSMPETYFDTPKDVACEACSCGAWAGATCAPAPLTCYNNSPNCGGNQTIVLTPQDLSGDCEDTPNLPGTTNRSCRLTGTSSVMEKGACPPSGGAVMMTELFENQNDFCGGTMTGGGGCNNPQQVCVPRGSGDYNGPVCIRKEGSAMCPPQWGNTPIEMAETGDDNRTCSDCACDVSGVTCTMGSYTLYDFDDCDGNTTITVNSMNCVNATQILDSDTGSVKPTLPVAQNGTCQATGGEPMGSVELDSPITVCCK